MNIKVLLADDHKIVRDGLRTLLENHPEITVVGEAEDGRETVQLAQKLAPAVVIMDIAMPDLNGIEATRQIISEHPHIKVVALSMHSDRRFVSEMLKAGASAYLLKDCAFEELVNAILTVMKNKIYLSPAIAGVVIENYIRNAPKSEPSVFSLLSDREREVLQLMAEGKATKEIASHLHVSIKTVETHRMNIMTKLDIHSVAELTKYAIREGLTSL
ncbi:MAG TPA: response regulator transcription factor [Thermodesulfovibrionales bacterium]|nr:response regulator transcription factor [Thermodesulfovibrionales bacterium]